MKASELDKGLQVLDRSSTDEEERSYYIHPQQIPVYEAFQKVNQSFERSISDRDMGLVDYYSNCRPSLWTGDKESGSSDLPRKGPSNRF